MVATASHTTRARMHAPRRTDTRPDGTARHRLAITARAKTTARKCRGWRQRAGTNDPNTPPKQASATEATTRDQAVASHAPTRTARFQRAERGARPVEDL